MKKNIIPIVLALTSSMANAEYLIKDPLEQAQGGSLPNGSILFINQPTAPIENWVAIEPLLSDWYTIGEPFDCLPDEWVPEPSTIAEGEVFTQTNQFCYIREERTVQSREQETTTGIIRNVGDAKIESGDLDASGTREAVGTLNAWEKFATDRKLPNDWNKLDWSGRSLTSLPNAPYPLTNPEYVRLNNNQLTNVNGLSNLTNAEYLVLSNNQLTNVDGLSNLTSVGSLELSSNQLTNVYGLRNLTSLNILMIDNNQLNNIDDLINFTTGAGGYGIAYITLSNNQLTNVNGLINIKEFVDDLDLTGNKIENLDGISNLKITYYVAIDEYSGKKIQADSTFCSDIWETQIQVAQKTQVCETN